jgi:hypothetical protein
MLAYTLLRQILRQFRARRHRVKVPKYCRLAGVHARELCPKGWFRLIFGPLSASEHGLLVGPQSIDSRVSFATYSYGFLRFHARRT